MIVGALNTALTFTIFSLLVLAMAPYQFALVGSALAGILFSAALNKSFTFGGLGKGYFLAFVAVYVLTVGLNIYLVGMMIDAAQLSPITAQAILVLPVAALTFSLLATVDRLFRRRTPAPN